MVTFRSAAGTRNDRAIRWVAVTTIVPSRFSMKKALATNSARARQDRAGLTNLLTAPAPQKGPCWGDAPLWVAAAEKIQAARA